MNIFMPILETYPKKHDNIKKNELYICPMKTSNKFISILLEIFDKLRNNVSVTSEIKKYDIKIKDIYTSLILDLTILEYNNLINGLKILTVYNSNETPVFFINDIFSKGLGYKNSKSFTERLRQINNSFYTKKHHIMEWDYNNKCWRKMRNPNPTHLFTEEGLFELLCGSQKPIGHVIRYYMFSLFKYLTLNHEEILDEHKEEFIVSHQENMGHYKNMIEIITKRNENLDDENNTLYKKYNEYRGYLNRTLNNPYKNKQDMEKVMKQHDDEIEVLKDNEDGVKEIEHRFDILNQIQNHVINSIDINNKEHMINIIKIKDTLKFYDKINKHVDNKVVEDTKKYIFKEAKDMNYDDFYLEEDDDVYDDSDIELELEERWDLNNEDKNEKKVFEHLDKVANKVDETKTRFYEYTNTIYKNFHNICNLRYDELNEERKRTKDNTEVMSMNSFIKIISESIYLRNHFKPDIIHVVSEKANIKKAIKYFTKKYDEIEHIQLKFKNEEIYGKVREHLNKTKFRISFNKKQFYEIPIDYLRAIETYFIYKNLTKNKQKKYTEEMKKINKLFKDNLTNNYIKKRTLLHNL